MNQEGATKIIREFFTKTKGQDTFALSEEFIKAREFLCKSDSTIVENIFKEINGDKNK